MGMPDVLKDFLERLDPMDKSDVWEWANGCPEVAKEIASLVSRVDEQEWIAINGQPK